MATSLQLYAPHTHQEHAHAVQAQQQGQNQKQGQQQQQGQPKVHQGHGDERQGPLTLPAPGKVDGAKVGGRPLLLDAGAESERSGSPGPSLAPSLAPASTTTGGCLSSLASPSPSLSASASATPTTSAQTTATANAGAANGAGGLAGAAMTGATSAPASAATPKRNHSRGDGYKWRQYGYKRLSCGVVKRYTPRIPLVVPLFCLFPHVESTLIYTTLPKFPFLVA